MSNVSKLLRAVELRRSFENKMVSDVSDTDTKKKNMHVDFVVNGVCDGRHGNFVPMHDCLPEVQNVLAQFIRPLKTKNDLPMVGGVAFSGKDRQSVVGYALMDGTFEPV